MKPHLTDLNTAPPMKDGEGESRGKLMSMTAREPSSVQSGESNMTKKFEPNMKFGKLGSRGYGGNGRA